MLDSVLKFVTRWVDTLDLSRRSTLELGAYNENGSVKPLFHGRYVGVDMRPGPDVDLVINAHDIVNVFGLSRFDVVVSTEMLEHDDAFWMTFAAVNRVLKADGFFIVTARGIGFERHDYPSDYYRFTEEALMRLFERFGFCTIEIVPCPYGGVMGIGRKMSDA